jgi:hypothetical protein
MAARRWCLASLGLKFASPGTRELCEHYGQFGATSFGFRGEHR